MKTKNNSIGMEIKCLTNMINKYFNKDEVMRVIANILKADDIYTGSIINNNDIYISIGAIDRGVEVNFFNDIEFYNIILENKADVCIFKMYLEN